MNKVEPLGLLAMIFGTLMIYFAVRIHWLKLDISAQEIVIRSKVRDVNEWMLKCGSLEKDCKTWNEVAEDKDKNIRKLEADIQAVRQIVDAKGSF